jgi:hypothetical protein
VLVRCLIVTLCIAGIAVSGLWALHLLSLSQASTISSGDAATPQIMFISNERQVALDSDIRYYTQVYPSQESLAYGRPVKSFPTGARVIDLSFSGGRPGSELSYAILLNAAASETNVTGQQGQGVSLDTPGSIIQADCSSPSTMGITEALSGVIHLNQAGDGSAIVAGYLADQHAFLTHGSNSAVNLLQILPAVTDIEPPGHIGQGCSLRLPDWRGLSRAQWFSPTHLTGTLDLGSVGPAYSVESSNPALADLSSIAWNIDGASAFNYTLINESLIRDENEDLFWAGALAAFAAALVLEAVKSGSDLLGELSARRRSSGNVPDRPPVRPAQHAGLVYAALAGLVASRLIRRRGDKPNSRL